MVLGVILFIKPEQFQNISKITSRLGSEIKEKNNLNFYLYGIGYAIVSLGCTLAVFMVVVFSVFKSGDIGKGIFNFFLYGLGMGIVVTLITIFSLLAKEVVQNWLRKIVPYINKIAAILVFITGIYLIIYWI
jgi:cytochrome c biogenesis protein CcdA